MYKTDKEMREAGYPLEYDNTMLTGFEECRRKFYWFWRGLDYAKMPSYFAWGRAWQEGLAKWYTVKGDMGYRLKEAIAAAERCWGDCGAMEHGNDTVENLRYLLIFYAVEYEEESWKIIAPDGKMELGFSFPLRSTIFSLGGAIDGYFQWKQHGIGHLENKSTGLYLNDQYMSQWSFSPQIRQYHWGLWQLLGEEPFGCIMNAVSKRLSQKAKDAFMQTGELPENQFMRNLEKVSKFKIDEFEENCLITIGDIVREWDQWKWSKCRNQLNCVGGIGKSPCLYKRLCLADVEPWNLSEGDILGSDIIWRNEPWEPWKRGRGKLGESEVEENGKASKV